MRPDDSDTPQPKPMAFAFERRDGHPFDEALYFSSAPLKTQDHLNCLDDLEKMLAE